MSFTRIFTLNLVEFRETSSARLVLTSLKVGAKIHGIIGNRVRSYSKQGYGDESFAYHEKGLSVAYFIQDEDWSLKALEAVNLLNTEEDSSPLVLLPNPGDSILTRLVLEMTNCSVVTWEARETFFSHLQALADDFKTRHFNFKKSFVRERDFEGIVNDNFNRLERGWTVNIFGNIPEIETYIPKMLFSLSREEGLWKLGNIPHFLFVSGLEYRLMTEPDFFWAHRIYQRTSLYKLFFEIKHILTVPAEAFNRRLLKTSAKFNITYDKDNMYLVKLSVRDEWFSVITRIEILGLVRLLKTISLKKGHRAIPTMEKWCPDIGIPLISFGVGMMDRIKDVPLDVWPSVYKALTENKHFPYSPMKHIMEGGEASRAATRKILDE